MTEIPRYRMTNNFRLKENANGAWVQYEDHATVIKAAVLAERVRCLEIVENIHGSSVYPDGYSSVYPDGYRRPDPNGGLISRSRVETAIKWSKV